MRGSAVVMMTATRRDRSGAGRHIPRCVMSALAPFKTHSASELVEDCGGQLKSLKLVMTHQLCREDGVQSTALRPTATHGKAPASFALASGITF